jgi:site-specific recombinase XerD
MKPSAKKRALGRMQTRLGLRGLRPRSVETYQRAARQFLDAVGKLPSQVTRRDVERYLVGLAHAGKSASTQNVALASIRFLLQATTSSERPSSSARSRAVRGLVRRLRSWIGVQRLRHVELSHVRRLHGRVYALG